MGDDPLLLKNLSPFGEDFTYLNLGYFSNQRKE